MSQARVLIVDDEPFARQTLSEWLREVDFHVFEAEGGKQAMKRIQEDEPDIVISDMVMPGMDGLELLKKTKAVRNDVPFLMVSGYPSTSTAVKVMKQGASDYLAKPFTPDELTRRVNQVLLSKALAKPLSSSKGLLLGAVLSAVMWLVMIRAISTLLS